ncbi:MAG TPA: TonB family protein [Longimicrobium sp.]|nr:TonB family protein [Longimicrobium sp.]
MGHALSRNFSANLRNLHQPVSGAVQVRFRLLETGEPGSSSIRVLWADRSEFAAAAARVILVMRFRPARVGGRAVPVWVSLPVTFELSCMDRRC